MITVSIGKRLVCKAVGITKALELIENEVNELKSDEQIVLTIWNEEE